MASKEYDLDTMSQNEIINQMFNQTNTLDSANQKNKLPFEALGLAAQ